MEKVMTAARERGYQMRARTMTIEELSFAINDCKACIDLNVNPSYYFDEASIYRQEINRRIKLTSRCPKCGK